MRMLLVPVLIVLVVLTVVSLVRGIVAFLRASREELEHPTPAGQPSPNQLHQNRMMFARIKYQAAAVVVVALLLAMAR
ncbi:twin transmembrane helix small protein [Novosphingobium sp. 9]|uniref:twin transmembrane helix small protein n=1 Tax=Novosphingobium sp. 9 TaxID=2025349 RepID=UPI0021B627FF|nr:twin transmembrane helix small protein [Novosphingobium sp. 9]